MSTRKTKTIKPAPKKAPSVAATQAPSLLSAPPIGETQPDGFELSDMEAAAIDEADRQAKQAYEQYTRAAVVLCDVLVDAVSARAVHRESSNRVRDTLAAAVKSRGLPTDTGGWRYTPGARNVERIKPGS